MKQTPLDLPELYQTLVRISHKINTVERVPYHFGLPEPLHLSEIHTLQAIGNTPDNNVGIIAGLIGVTPSATSQVITKLAKRGLVHKVRGVRNEKEVLLKLTPQGLIVYHNHEKIHAEKCDRIFKQVGPLSIEERAILERVLSAIEFVYTESIEEHNRESNNQNPSPEKNNRRRRGGHNDPERSVSTPKDRNKPTTGD